MMDQRGLRNAGLAVAMLFGLITLGYGQGRGGPQGPPPSPKAAAPIDLTGYWVSVVTEDWRYRMITPSKGDYQSVPMNPAGIKAADAWDPAKDEAAGEQCKSYGAAAIMRVPGRIHITWQDDNTLRIETDAGTQTRLLHFGAWKAPGGDPTLQGDSVAQWEAQRMGRGAAAPPPKSGDLKVVTTHMLAGYLRKNGVPYSANAVLTEYYDVIRGVDGNMWLAVTSMVDDPAFLRMSFITSSNFKKQADGSGWDPSPCSSR
jgi:hypothetical protein